MFLGAITGYPAVTMDSPNPRLVLVAKTSCGWQLSIKQFKVVTCAEWYCSTCNPAYFTMSANS
jgi:hypothetical protein